MMYNALAIIIILCYMIIIYVTVMLAALFSLSDSILTILCSVFIYVLYIVVLSNKHVPSFLPS